MLQNTGEKTKLYVIAGLSSVI